MECLAVIAVSAALIFARLAMMQDLNPLLWGALAVACYVGPPVWMIQRGASWFDAPLVWASSFGALFALFVVQTVVAERKRYKGRAPAAPSKAKSVYKRKG
jgi:hypothetical protein